jgi:4-amino-4-deoxy-L-arabinose transferase-like glycosyltransferase
VIAAALLVRVAGLARFPAVSLDEGLWTRSAKNYVLFGDWFLDRHWHMLFSPVFHVLEVLAFAVFSPSTVVARVLSALAGTLSVWLLYVLVRRVTGRRDLALTTAVVFAFCQWTVVQSRAALIEPLQLVVVLGSAALLVQGRKRDIAAAGAIMGLGLLTKVNTVFLLGAFGIFLLLPLVEAAGRSAWRRHVGHALLFGVAALAVAAPAYMALSRAFPQQFHDAYFYEIAGEHFAANAETPALIQLGRFGLDPVMASRTILQVLRMEPFLMVLCLLGLAAAIAGRKRGGLFFGVWLTVGMVFFLTQMVQPIRYLYLLTPAFAFFAALFVRWLGDLGAAHVPARRVAAASLGIYLAFEVSYTGMNAAANRETRIPEIVSWAATHTRPTDRFLASAYFCTDLPNPALGFYLIVSGRDDLVPAIRRHRIDYVIVDDEWSEGYVEEIEKHYEAVARWPFATIYRVNASEPVESRTSLSESAYDGNRRVATR